jgi:ABC-type uncharacterized transport system fused permease/ATPase subunit
VEEANAVVTAALPSIQIDDDEVRFNNVSIRTPVTGGDLKISKAKSDKEKLLEARVAALENSLKIDRPGTSTLVRDCSVVVPGSLCVSGVGKSSILRTLHGMWPAHTLGGDSTKTSAAVIRPQFGENGIVMIPQQAYASQGTLAAQVVYPLTMAEAKPLNSEIDGILREVGLQDIAQRWGLHKVVDWDLVLSGGECQRLHFARLLYHQPRFAVLDETTSALDMTNEKLCMNTLTKRNMTMISFAARPSIIEYHQQHLHISENCEPVLTAVPKNALNEIGPFQRKVTDNFRVNI